MGDFLADFLSDLVLGLFNRSTKKEPAPHRSLFGWLWACLKTLFQLLLLAFIGFYLYKLLLAK